MEERKEEGEAEIQEHGPEHWFSKWERQCLAEAEQDEQLSPELQEEAAAAAQPEHKQQKLWHLFQNSATAVAQLYKGEAAAILAPPGPAPLPAPRTRLPAPRPHPRPPRRRRRWPRVSSGPRRLRPRGAATGGGGWPCPLPGLGGGRVSPEAGGEGAAIVRLWGPLVAGPGGPDVPGAGLQGRGGTLTGFPPSSPRPPHHKMAKGRAGAAALLWSGGGLGAGSARGAPPCQPLRPRRGPRPPRRDPGGLLSSFSLSLGFPKPLNKMAKPNMAVPE